MSEKWYDGDLGICVGIAAIILAGGLSIAACFAAGCDRQLHDQPKIGAKP